jgi:putative ABC transport system permease protein
MTAAVELETPASTTLSVKDLIGFAGGAITAHPMRSVLTSLGVVIGVAAVVMMTSIGLGAQQQVTKTIGALGSNLIIVRPGQPRGAGGTVVRQAAGGGISLTQADADAIKATVENVVAVAPAVQGQAQLSSDTANWNSRIEGVTPDYLAARDITLSAGRMIEEREARTGDKKLLIGKTVADELFPNEDPLGKRVRVGNTPFEVIGVLTPRGQSGMGIDQDDVVLGPLAAVRSRIVGRRVNGTSVQTVYVKAATAEDMNTVQEDVTNLLRDRHRIREGQDDDFNVQNMASILEATKATTQTFTILLAAVAGVSLVVGGVGIMNIMLVAVTERTREIGLRMAVGARRSDVLYQFALEAVALSLLGGLIGLAIGVLGALAAAKLGNWPTAIPSWAAPLSIGFSVLVGLVFGAYPSWRAAQLDPIEALRRE